MSTPPWMPLNVDDYLADTAHLSAAEHGAYLLLIMRYWKDGGLPADEHLIARYSRLSPEQWAESRDVLASFFADGWRHHRIDAELSKAAEVIGKRKAAAEERHARKSAHAEHVDSTSDAHAVHMQSKSTYAGVPHRTNNIPSSLRSEGERASRAARLPEDWSLPDEWRSDALDAGLPTERIDLEAANLRDWSRSSPKGAKLDWRATWRTWCRRKAEELPPVRGQPPPRIPSQSDVFRLIGERASQHGQDADDFGGFRPALPDLSTG